MLTYILINTHNIKSYFCSLSNKNSLPKAQAYEPEANLVNFIRLNKAENMRNSH